MSVCHKLQVSTKMEAASWHFVYRFRILGFVALQPRLLGVIRDCHQKFFRPHILYFIDPSFKQTDLILSKHSDARWLDWFPVSVTRQL